MQQAHSEQPSTVDTTGTGLPGATQLNAFVINLCSSTSPVTLTQPDHAGLKRFTFFVSRRREESRERFRLHMGYFDTQEEAEKLLDIVREIYPGAWAGLAPGQRLRAAAARTADIEVAHEAAAATPVRTADIEVAHEAAAATPVRTADIEVAQLDLEVGRGAAAEVAVAAPVTQAMTEPVPAQITSPVAESVQSAIAPLTLVPDEGRRLPTGQSRATENVAAARSLNDVRAAIAALDDTSGRAPVLRPIPELKPAPPARNDKSATPGKPAGPAAPATSALATLAKPAGPAAAATASAEAIDANAAPLSDVGALALLESAPRGEKPCFAVQLVWSVQPIDIAQVPKLAIFSAYTLYGAEGNRDGRRWYGMRLGFFTDAVSAKQVAHYVRSEFATVSVVPVTPRERERARLAATRPPSGVATLEAPSIVLATPPAQQFEFIEDKSPAQPPSVTPASGAPRAPRAPPGKRAKLRTQSGAVKASARVKPMTLEETLEILGAGELQMDDGRAPLINDTGAAPAKAKPTRNKASRLGRLLERLSERIGS